MKIIVIAYRTWTIGREYRSLVLNAKRLGHQVWGFAETCHGDAPLTIAAFQELGVEAYRGEELEGLIDEIDPDVVFGGRYRPRFPIERLAQDWVNSHDKIGFLLHHYIMPAPGCEGGKNPGPRTHLSCTNEAQAESCIGPKCRSVWPGEQVHVLGAPGFDVAFEDIDVAAVRTKLGVEPDQPLIGLFPDTRGNKPPREKVIEIIQEASHRGWKIVVHPHPIARRLQYSDDVKAGFFNRPDVAEALLGMQEAGATIIVDYAPGTMMGIRFQRCSGFELHAAADCLLSSSSDPIWEAYIIGKRCHFHFHSHLTKYPLEIVDMDFEKGFDNNIDKIVAVLKRDSEYIEHDPRIIKRWYYKLDGLWWQRALNLAQELKGE